MKNISNIFYRVVSYFNYCIVAKNKYSVHSPFMFDFVTNVLNKKSHDKNFIQIELVRKKLKNNKNKIAVNDLGNEHQQHYIISISEIAKKSSKNRKYAALLNRMVEKYQPDSILELGTCFGISTLYLSSGNKNAKIITVEGCKNRASIAQENFNIFNFSNIEIINHSFDDAIKKFQSEKNFFSFIFIDGHHQKQPTINYFEKLLNCIIEETIVVIDDIHWSKDMHECWKYLIVHPKVKVSVDIFQMGILFFKNELSKENFIVRF